MKNEIKKSEYTAVLTGQSEWGMSAGLAYVDTTPPPIYDGFDRGFLFKKFFRATRMSSDFLRIFVRFMKVKLCKSSFMRFFW